MPYVSISDDDAQAMLERIGVGSIDDLFASIPEDARFRGPLGLPAAASELTLRRELRDGAQETTTLDTTNSFLGAGVLVDCPSGPSPEVNDGLDNDCNGLRDEIKGNAGFHTPFDDTTYSWPAQPGASEYQVARSTSPDFSGCVTVNTSDTFITAGPPPPGENFYFLVRAVSPNVGSWGQDSGLLPGAERDIPCASPTESSPGGKF